MTIILLIGGGVVLITGIVLFVRARVILATSNWVPPPHGSTRLFGRKEAGQPFTFDYSQNYNLGSKVTVRDDTPMPMIGDTRERIRQFPTDVLDGVYASTTLYAASVAWSDTAVAKTLDRIGHDFDKFSTLDIEAIAGNASDAGYVSWLKGHVAETLAAEHLTAAGHDVTFAEVSNQPGWDLVVDGQEYNVKVGEAVLSNISDHLDKYPNIPVLTSESAAKLIDSDQVMGLPNLEGEMVAESLAESSDALEALEVADTGIPIFTAIRTSWRELRIQVDHGKGDVKQIVGESLVTGAVVTGAMFLPPVGIPALLACLGGLLIKGKIMSAIHLAQLRRDLEWFAERFKPTRDAVYRADSEWQAQSKAIQKKQSQKLNKELLPIKQAMESQASALASSATADLRKIGSAIALGFDVLQNGIQQDRETVLRSTPRRSRLKRAIWPTKADSILLAQLEWLAKTESRLNWHRIRISNAVSKIEAGDAITKGLRRFSTAIRDFVKEYSILPKEFHEVGSVALERAFRLAKVLDDTWDAAMRQSIPIRNKCVKEGHEEYQKLIGNDIRELLKKVASHSEDGKVVAAQAVRANVKMANPVDDVSNWLTQVNRVVLAAKPLEWTVGDKESANQQLRRKPFLA